MTNVLIIKMSSLGDVIHCLPAIADAAGNCDEIRIDWVVEEAYQAIAEKCEYVDRVIPIALRRWRRRLWDPLVWKEMIQFRQNLQQKSYDLVIDAQGLIKSALVACVAKGSVTGLAGNSAREPLGSLLYQTKISVPKDMHAIKRTRLLFSEALKYSYPDQAAEFGLSVGDKERASQIFLLHGTTWSSKEWPISQWIRLSEMMVEADYEPCLTWGNELEKERCEAIARKVPGVCIIPRLDLEELLSLFAALAGVVTVDTGLGHLAAALGKPVVSVFGATDPKLTGISGSNVTILSDQGMECVPCRKKLCKYKNYQDSSKIYPPCYETISAEIVWQKLRQQIND